MKKQIHYHGTDGEIEELDIYRRLCLTSRKQAAELYGPELHSCNVDMDMLRILDVEVENGEYLDDASWPDQDECLIFRAEQDGYNAIRYQDVAREYGLVHDTLVLLTEDAYLAITAWGLDAAE